MFFFHRTHAHPGESATTLRWDFKFSKKSKIVITRTSTNRLKLLSTWRVGSALSTISLLHVVWCGIVAKPVPGTDLWIESRHNGIHVWSELKLVQSCRASSNCNLAQYQDDIWLHWILNAVFIEYQREERHMEVKPKFAISHYNFLFFDYVQRMEILLLERMSSSLSLSCSFDASRWRK